MYIKEVLSKYLKANRWPKSGPFALNGVLLVAQKWPVGKQEVEVPTIFRVIAENLILANRLFHHITRNTEKHHCRFIGKL